MIIIYVEETFARGLVLRRVPDLRRPMSIPAEIDDVELRQRLESKQPRDGNVQQSQSGEWLRWLFADDHRCSILDARLAAEQARVGLQDGWTQDDLDEQRKMIVLELLRGD